MNKQELEYLVNQGNSSWDISRKLNKSQTTVRYWLKKHSIKTKYSFSTTDTHKTCPMCKIEKLHIEFTIRKNNKINSYCKICTNKYTVEKQRKFKEQCLNYKGNSCVRCGYNRCSSALEFHHTDPTKKEFSISSKKLYKFNKDIQDELDKCIVLCSNCHKEAHTE